MVFPAAIREKSQRGVALSCDAHVVSARSGEIRQPCTESLCDQVLSETFFFKSAFLRGKLVTHSVLGGHLLRAQVPVEKESMVFKSALVRILPR